MRLVRGDMRTAFGLGKRIGSFGGLPLLGMLAPFFMLPIIARVGGVHGWTAIAVGQSAGVFAATAVAYGWPLVGPAAVALSPTGSRPQIYARSLAMRITLFMAAGPIAATVAWRLSPEGFGSLAALMAIASASNGLSNAWFCIGAGKPRLIATFEVLPRLLATGVAALLVLRTGELIIYPSLALSVSLASSVAFSVFVLKKGGANVKAPLADWVRDFRAQGSAAAAALSAASYTSAPVLIVAGVSSPAVAALFVAADKIYRASLFTISSLCNALQGWTVEPGRGLIPRRVRLALFLHLVLGVLGGLAVALFAPMVSRALFGQSFAFDTYTAAWYGVAFFCVSANTALGRLILIPTGRTKALLGSTLVGAIVGVASITLFATWFGSAGGAGGVALGEAAVVVVQGAVVFAFLRAPGGSMLAIRDETATAREV